MGTPTLVRGRSEEWGGTWNGNTLEEIMIKLSVKGWEVGQGFHGQESINLLEKKDLG